MLTPSWWGERRPAALSVKARENNLLVRRRQAGQWGFIEYRPPNKKPEYRPNIDHTALYRPNIDRKISLKNEYYRN